jgi:fatty-acid peroxygenase
VSLDLGLHLLRSGYRALPEERSAHDGADAFTTSLLGRRAVVVRGREGARLFYDGEVTHRRGAVPPLLAGLLFGRGAVHGLDGADHATRKAMFLEILSDERVDPLAGAIGRDLDRRTRSWPGREVPVFDELVLVYGAAVQAWAGIPAPTARTSRRLAAIVDGFGGSPVAYPRAWAARLRADRWATRLVREVRSGAVHPPAGSVLQLLAGGPGRDLDARTAGIELLNILRPTVAVAWPGTFLARALSEHPSWRSRLVGADANGLRTAFGHEVRRTCPFAPALAARAHRAAQVDGVRVEPGDFVVLDIPGTGRDPTWWADADEFRPERFADLMPDPFAFVPQGGGDPDTGHRCPGEPLTVRILSETARVLAGVDYEPVGDTSFDPTRIPTLPRGGFVVRTSPD